MRNSIYSLSLIRNLLDTYRELYPNTIFDESLDYVPIIDCLYERNNEWKLNRQLIINFMIDFNSNPGIINKDDATFFTKLIPKFKKVLGIETDSMYYKYISNGFENFLSAPYKAFNERMYEFMLFRACELMFINWRKQYLYLLVCDNNGNMFCLIDIRNVYNAIIENYDEDSIITLDFINI